MSQASARVAQIQEILRERGTWPAEAEVQQEVGASPGSDWVATVLPDDTLVVMTLCDDSETEAT